ncbi:MAG: Fe(2+) transporter permease subunit FeoB [Candidatus Cloacimonetes bacterium]|nr:Fe(2+) transporter permease subunit FeoB [Candidatus Cloacimonadota bacterium]
MKRFTLALAGNPNCGKTTLFNALTGSRQRVGNWPGVTVERIEGFYRHQDYEFEIIDLPGIYSFSAYSLDEKVSREYILLGKPDLVINIVDASNLERTLYLTTQLLEMRIPVIVALNMMDVAAQNSIRIDLDHLARHLDCPVIATVATRREGLIELKDKINEYVAEHHISTTRVQYDSVVEEAVARLSEITESDADTHSVDKRWLAIKLLENDHLARELTQNKYSQIVAEESARIKKHTNLDTDIVIADGRYGFIHGLFKDVVRKEVDYRRNVSDLIDKVVLNKVLSVPIFLAVMYLVFTLTIKAGSPFIDFFDGFMGTIFVDGFGDLLRSWHFPGWVILLLSNGIGGGIQTLSTFIPPVFFMFFSLALLEDSGYMSRAAFVMDRFMRLIGLPGKAFIPMLVGFGCNVPAILATRTLENRRDRLLTILINPFMSCGARLPVYVLFTSIFFREKGGLIIFGLYLTGILLAVISGFVFKRTILKGETSTFVMELPPYHLPTLNGIMMHTWQRLQGFLWRAGKIIIFFIIILNILGSLNPQMKLQDSNFENSILSYSGKAITPLFKPMGISEDNWPATVGLITGIFAKETIVSTLHSLYTRNEQSGEKAGFWEGIKSSFLAIPDGFGLIAETDEEDGPDKDFTLQMKNRFGGANNALAYLLFVLIYVPCVGTIAVIYRETGWKWTVFAVSYLTILAWIVATFFYQTATFFQHPLNSLFWIAFSALLLAVIYFLLHSLRNKRVN